VPAVTAQGHQHVCGEICRRGRRNGLARRRRRGDVDEQRVDERARQQKRRDAVKASIRHGPASDANQLEALRKVKEIVDKAAAASRATFHRDAMRILRRCGPFLATIVDGVGARHGLPCGPGAGETGSRSAVGVDTVTDQHGAA
jgi:hypothetical protein